MLRVAQFVKEFYSFYEREYSLPCLEEPATIAYSSQTSPFYALTSYFFNSHCNIFLRSKLRSTKSSLSLWFSYEHSVCISFLSYMCHIPHPSHTHAFDYPTDIWRGLKITTLCIIQFSPIRQAVTFFYSALRNFPFNP